MPDPEAPAGSGQVPVVYRFGDFELDTGRYELRRIGVPVKVEKLPFELLRLLVERGGLLVTREEIAARLWDRTHGLDVEQGINTAVRKARQALEPSPELLGTIVGKGYRFEAEVTRSVPPAASRVEVVAPAGRGTPGAAAPAESPAEPGAPGITPGRPDTASGSAAVPATWSSVRRRRGRALGLGALLLLAVGAVVWSNARSRPGPSIAVLPLENRSGKPEDVYLADGLTDALITELARFRGLRVTARTSVFQYRGKSRPVPEIASALGVDTVVTGSVVRQGDRMRITAQLIDARRDRHLWAESYDRDVRDVLRLEAEVAGNIARRVLVTLSPEEMAELQTHGSVDPVAFDEAMRGRALWGKRSEAALQEALRHYQAAVERDPGFAAAWSGLADAHCALGYTSIRPPSDSFPLVREAALRAPQLDPRSAEAEAALAYTRLYFEWDWPGAEAAFQRATRLDPSSATAHHWYSVFLTARGRFDEAAREIAEARRLDPLSPAIATDVGFELYYAGKYAPAVAQLQEVLRTAPAFPLAHLWLGRTYQAQRAWPAALGEYAEVDRLQPDWPVTLAAMGHVLGVSGERDQARAILGRMERLATSRYVTPYGVALVHAGLGDADGAFQWLSRAVDDRSHWLVWLSLDPRFADLRGDPRFAAVLQRMGW
jgi:TolB-like protein/DNA-binding winged helix-turn-helix (wHTH) protein/Flp pilus assembly protein TadD